MPESQLTLLTLLHNCCFCLPPPHHHFVLSLSLCFSLSFVFVFVSPSYLHLSSSPSSSLEALSKTNPSLLIWHIFLLIWHQITQMTVIVISQSVSMSAGVRQERRWMEVQRQPLLSRCFISSTRTEKSVEVDPRTKTQQTHLPTQMGSPGYRNILTLLVCDSTH